jgi:hypothetical protein
MALETFPRLAVRLRSSFPDQKISLLAKGEGLRVRFRNFPAWDVVVSMVSSVPPDNFHTIVSSVSLRYECLKEIPEDEFLKFIAAENLGLRGVTLVADESEGQRVIVVRSTFLAQKGRTRDEAENLVIDILSLLRYCRLLEDRITNSTPGEMFSYELYFCTYLSKGLGRNRFINYARSIFDGSTERVFGQFSDMLLKDYSYPVQIQSRNKALITPPESNLEIHLKIPEEIPMLICQATLAAFEWDISKSFALVSKLNSINQTGHFEVNADGFHVSFSAWKHLTNDLRYYSLDKLIQSVPAAEKLLQRTLREMDLQTSRPKYTEPRPGPSYEDYSLEALLRSAI